MNTKTLSQRSLDVIDQYLNFKLGSGTTSIPYFNNKVHKTRLALRAYVGKGSPKEIFEEAEAYIIKNHVAQQSLDNNALKKILVDNNIGIDCSAFAYYVLNAESEEMKKGSLDRHMHFINCHGIVGKIKCSLRPVENCDVATIADEKNSKSIKISEILPGDMIIMLSSSDAADRNHILIIHQVDYQNFIPSKIYYSHAIAYPEDGVYNTGVRQGSIEITDINKALTENIWTEDGKSGRENRLLEKALKSKTEIRRLRWFN